MTEISDINAQYNMILTQLQLMNPKYKLDEIKSDIEEHLFDLFIDEIEIRKFSRDISYYKVKRDLIKQKLQFSRQSSKLRDVMDDKIKVETNKLKLKRIKNSLKRKAFFDTLDYPGNFSKQELLYINHTDKTYQGSEFPENEKNENQDLLSQLKQDVKTTSNQKIILNEIDKNAFELKSEFPEIEETIDIFKCVVEKEDRVKKVDIKTLDLDQELRNRILKLVMKPITKEKADDINLMQYIGFVDKD
ncbi:hypothetical protein LCGC14_0786510 [marine sediment metagenome]|uniref:Uncharacterized protein n=1 Tax=marine sediment metagenome TaxID=412755 RepID=A0A0F9QDP3_9ZZZZ|nr:MAG: hypothetical protein Lokiarch_52270 [Candidatus Lokiarchaeum sp. GC14_75]